MLSSIGHWTIDTHSMERVLPMVAGKFLRSGLIAQGGFEALLTESATYPFANSLHVQPRPRIPRPTSLAHQQDADPTRAQSLRGSVRPFRAVHQAWRLPWFDL